MAVKNTAQVVIDGKIITLGGYESEEYFQKVVKCYAGLQQTAHGDQAYTAQSEYYR